MKLVYEERPQMILSPSVQPRKVHFIVDNLKVHYAKIFKACLAEHRDEIAIGYLPSYSPKLNPGEYINCDLKAGVHSGKPARNKELLKESGVTYAYVAGEAAAYCQLF